MLYKNTFYKKIKAYRHDFLIIAIDMFLYEIDLQHISISAMMKSYKDAILLKLWNVNIFQLRMPLACSGLLL